jgi:hypothetical protein
MTRGEEVEEFIRTACNGCAAWPWRYDVEAAPHQGYILVLCRYDWQYRIVLWAPGVEAFVPVDSEQYFNASDFAAFAEINAPELMP